LAETLAPLLLGIGLHLEKSVLFSRTHVLHFIAKGVQSESLVIED
jgi:hypothetical protein